MKLNAHKTPTNLEMLVFAIQDMSEKERSVKKLLNLNVDQTATETVSEYVFVIPDILKILQAFAYWIIDVRPMKSLMEVESVSASQVSTEIL